VLQLPRGLISAAAAGLLLALAGCGTLPGRDSGIEAGPDAGLVARYDSIVARLAQPGDAAAVEDLRRFSSQHPEFAGPLLNLALLSARAGDPAAAISYLDRAAATCTRCAPVYNELGVIRRQQGEFDAAEKAYRTSIRLESDYAPAYYNLAVLYDLYIQRPELALDAYQRFLVAAPAAADRAAVEKWVIDLKRRVSVPAQAAQAGPGKKG
jgi:tetratricopeptide (TPR) repeat protein